MLRCRISKRRHQFYMMVSAQSAGCSYSKSCILQKTSRHDSVPQHRWKIKEVRPAKTLVPAGCLSLRVTLPTNGVAKLIALERRYFLSSPDVQCASFASFPVLIPRHSIHLLPPVFGKQKFYSVTADYTVTEDSVSDANLSKNPTSGARFSRIARAEAQEALMEYLHGTRGLSYIDAEHISKNSPIFLDSLLAKVDNEQQARQSVRKFLHYNPINEFEPFFESLGLKPSELQSLLPHRLFFLHDDKVMLRNFQALCNFGIPRRKIGKMFKEAQDIFRYEFGTLEAHIQAYLNLGLSSSTLIKLVSCCPSLLVGDVNQEFVLVLEKLKGLGFGHFWIRGCLVEKNTYCWDKMLHMMDFLSEMGCSEDNLRDLIVRHPWFLFNESGKKVYAVAALLLKLGLKMDMILQLLLRCPQILSGSFVKNLHRSVNFLFEIGFRAEEIANIVYKDPQAMGYCLMKKPESVLSSMNVDEEFLRNLIVSEPHRLKDLAAKANTNSVLTTLNRSHPLEKTRFLLKLGFQENTEEMSIAQDQFRGRGDLLQERFDVLLNAGLDFHDACNLVKEAPQILNQTADVLEEKINYLVNYAGYPLNSLSVFPSYLCHNLDKIKLRFSMFHWLKQRGVVSTTVALSSIVASSTNRFERYYVNRVPDGPEVWKKFKETCST